METFSSVTSFVSHNNRNIPVASESKAPCRLQRDLKSFVFHVIAGTSTAGFTNSGSG